MLLKQHLDMIGRNEPIQRKARFWQSYVRALKGTDDMKAPEQTHYSRPRGIYRPLLTADYPSWPKSIYDDPIHPSDRITVPGYRYLPISREIYGVSPRNIYPHHYTSSDRNPRQDDPMDPLKVMEDAEAYEKRLEEIDELLPLKYRYPKTYRPRTQDYRAGSLPPIRASSVPPLRASSVPPLSTPPLRAMTPLRTYTPPPRYPSEKVGYSYSGLPVYSRGPLGRRALTELLEPSTWLPRSRITGDPWWWDYPSLRPYYSPLYYGRAPYYLRSSYLSPIKRTYLWGVHPIRPFSDPWWLDYTLRSAYRSRYYGYSPSVLHSSYTTPRKLSHVWNTEPFSDPWWWDYPSMKSHFSTINNLKNPVKRIKVVTFNPRWEYSSTRFWV